MEVQPDYSAGEIRRLQRCINDLISLLALPAIWTGSEPAQIVSSLLDSLLGMLRLDFVYGRLQNPIPIEIVRAPLSQKLTARPQDFAELFRSWLQEDPRKWPVVVPNPVGGGDISITPLRLGLHGEVGLIVAGSRRANFPRQTERLLLDVAANQAAIALQTAWLLSEQKRIANDERKQSEEGFRAIVETSPECVKVVARDGTLLQVNSAGLAMAGAPSADCVIGGNFYDFLAPEHREQYRKFHEKVCGGQKGFLEFDIINMQGERRHVESHSAPLRYNDGSIVQVGFTRDITARKQADQKLRESERNLNLIINTIPALAWAARTDGSAEFFNQHYLDYVGLSQEQLQDWKWTATVHPDDLDGLAEKWQSVMASGRAGETEARLRRFDGEYRRFLFRANPLRDESGNAVKWFGVNTDVEDRKRAEEELQRSEAFLAEGQRLSSTGSFFWRLDNDEIRFSAELYRLFEFEQNSPLTIERIASRVHPEDIPLLQEKIERARNDRGGLARIIHDSTPFFISAQCTHAVCLS
jgi:PAS domain S-box-containing protein